MAATCNRKLTVFGLSGRYCNHRHDWLPQFSVVWALGIVLATVLLGGSQILNDHDPLSAARPKILAAPSASAFASRQYIVTCTVLWTHQTRQDRISQSGLWNLHISRSINIFHVYIVTEMYWWVLGLHLLLLQMDVNFWPFMCTLTHLVCACNTIATRKRASTRAGCGQALKGKFGCGSRDWRFRGLLSAARPKRENALRKTNLETQTPSSRRTWWRRTQRCPCRFCRGSARRLVPGCPVKTSAQRCFHTKTRWFVGLCLLCWCELDIWPLRLPP